jgi:hypothetical protein
MAGGNTSDAGGAAVSDAGANSGGTTPPGMGGAVISRALRRLSIREYDNAVRDLLGDTTQPAAQFGIEVYPNGFDNGSDGLTVNDTTALSFQQAAEALAATAVTSQMPKLIGSCDPTINAQTCVTAFLQTFVTKAYRRPPTATEGDRLGALYTAGSTATGAISGFKGGIQLMLEGVLQSPAFLYREELGAPDPTLPTGVVRLTPFEVASELSFLLTGSTPDDELLAAASGGTLKTASDLQREAARLLMLDSRKPAFQAFMNHWMATTEVTSVSKDMTIYPQFTPALATSMVNELNGYFDQVLWAGTGSLREFLTSTQSVVDSALATQIYKIPAPTGVGPQLVSLDAQLRQGIMTRAGFLTAHSDDDSSGPVPRGVFVMQNLLCAPPPPPPANVPPAPPAATTAMMHQTTRQALGAHLNEPFCSSCHTEIDGIGFGFEEFDGLGIFRTTESGQPIDDSGSIAVGSDVDGTFTGASALEAKLVGSKQVIDCFARQVYRYAMGQVEGDDNTPLGTATNAVLASMQSGFTADTHITDAFLAIVADPSFVLRTSVNVGP